MRRIFWDIDIQQKFDRDGFVVVNLLPRETTLQLIQLYGELEGAKGTANTNQNSYELSFFDKNVEAKKKKFNSIYELLKSNIDSYLIDYKPIIVNLFNKAPSTGEVPIHQNWTFVDESKYSSVSVWCPLQNVDRQNGTLEVVPGSQKVISDYRGPSIPWVFDNLNPILKEKYMVPLNLEPGQVGIIDDALVHYSGINNSQNERKAVQLILKPAEAMTIHCYKDSEDSEDLHIIDVNEDFYFDFDMWVKPRETPNKKTIRFPNFKLTEQELRSRLSKNISTGE
jgi:hypothetical protein